jgi:hypothetical protein
MSSEHMRVRAPAPEHFKCARLYSFKTPTEEELKKVNPNIIKFGSFVLMRKWENPVTPKEFVLSARRALTDLQSGFDPKSGKIIGGLFESLTCQPPLVYRLLDYEIPTIAELFIHPDFAQETRKFWNEVEDHRKEKPSNI